MSGERPVALGIQGPYGGGAVGQSPLEMFGQVARIQNELNQNRLFQMEMAGRQRYGEIVANAPDLETGLNTALRDPIAGAFAANLSANLRQAQLAMTQMHGEIQRQATSGWDAVGQVMPAIMNDPNMTRERAQGLIDAKLGLLSPEARARVGPNISSVQDWIWDGNPTPQERNQRIAGALGAFGMGPADARDWAGTVRPEVTWQPGYPGGAPGPFQVGGAPGAPPGPPIPLAQPRGPLVPTPGPVTAAPPPAPGTAELPPVTVGAPAPRGGGITGIGLTPQQAEEQKATGQRAKDVEEGISETTKSLPGLQKDIDTMQGALGRFLAGGWSAGRAELARFVQGFGNTFGMSPEDIKNATDKITHGQFSAYDIFTSYIKSFAVKRLKDAAQGTGRVMKTEVDAFMSALDATRDPQALMTLINSQGRFLLQKGYDIAAKYPQFKEGLRTGRADTQGYDISSFDDWYANQYDERRLPTKTPRGQYIGPWPYRITGDADYNSLPDGGQFIAPGETRPQIKGGLGVR